MSASTTKTNAIAGMAAATDIAETTASCMRATAELHNKLAASWLDMFTLGSLHQPAGAPMSNTAQWSLEAMRLTAETMLRNIERCQECAQRSTGGKP